MEQISFNQSKNIPLSTIDLLISDEWILKLDVIFKTLIVFPCPQNIRSCKITKGCVWFSDVFRGVKCISDMKWVNHRSLPSMQYLTHFMPLVSFYTSWKGVWKETSAMKWVKCLLWETNHIILAGMIFCKLI